MRQTTAISFPLTDKRVPLGGAAEERLSAHADLLFIEADVRWTTSSPATLWSLISQQPDCCTSHSSSPSTGGQKKKEKTILQGRRRPPGGGPVHNPQPR